MSTHIGPWNRAERRARAGSKHSFKVAQTALRPEDPAYVLVRSTGRRPWTVRRERRAVNRQARASRKANRR